LEHTLRTPPSHAIQASFATRPTQQYAYCANNAKIWRRVNSVLQYPSYEQAADTAEEHPMPIQTKPNWQPLSLLPVLAMMIDEVQQNSEEQFETFSEVRNEPHVLDDAIALRATRLYKAQLEDVQLYREQLRRWQEQPLTADQRREVDRLLGQLPRIKQLSEAILELLDEIKEGTIDKILGKSDLEVGLEFLLGNNG
jgi:hypothetical protein